MLRGYFGIDMACLLCVTDIVGQIPDVHGRDVQ